MSLEGFSSVPWTASELVDAALTQLRPYHWHVLDVAVVCTAVWTFLRWRRTSRQARTTELQGPPSESFLYGATLKIFHSEDSGATFERWAQEYGSVYSVPWALGSRRVMLCDPKAIAHFYSKKTWTYNQIPANKLFFLKFLGKGLLWAEGELHQRQRKLLMPALSTPGVRQLTPIFYDLAHKAKGAWDVLIESSGGESAVIEVQSWVNHISLDALGFAAFHYNFGSLEGKRTAATEVIDEYTTFNRTGENLALFVMGQALPLCGLVPTSRRRLDRRLSVIMEGLSGIFLARAQKEREMGVVGGKEDRSIIGLLAKGMSDESELGLKKEEVVAQIKEIIVGGYEPVAVGMTWALLELAQNPDVQTKLRNELLEHGADPTYDELVNGLPYLDAVVHEILRVHPPVPDTEGMAIEDDVIPLSEPIRTKSGALVDSVTIAKGTFIGTSFESVNRSAAIWGVDAKVFRPSRWLQDEYGQSGIPAKAKEIQGYRHLLTFTDGPRVCPGKHFALLEFKVVLVVLIKNYVLELRDGADSKIEMGSGMLPRPKIAGEVGAKLPLRVRPYAS